MNYQGSFAKPLGELRTKEYSFNANLFPIDNNSQASYTSLSFNEATGEKFGAQPWRSVGTGEIDYELHLGIKPEPISVFQPQAAATIRNDVLEN